jgi:hypothetical protein
MMKTEDERRERLDIMTGLKTPAKMDRGQAAYRWHGVLERMYRVNGPLEF